MNKRILVATLLCFFFSIVSACEVNTSKIENVERIEYNFKEPSKFPFEVNEVNTEIDIKDVDYWYQFIFHYRNVETTQQINYILSRDLKNPQDNKISENFKSEHKKYTLKNGSPAYYEEDNTSQTLWWEGEHGFLARFVYFTNGNETPLGEYKLDAEEFVKLANQIQ